MVAKATNESIDILSLQASDDSGGAFDARTLCKNVVFPFQRDFLEDVLDGSNEDPLVNNPGRHPRLDKTNRSAGGDVRKALDMLCDSLPLVKTSQDARDCLDYLITQCLIMAESARETTASFSTAILTTDVFETRRFMNALLDKSFGGLSLLLVATSIYSVIFPVEDGYKVVPHPINQSGTSGKQMGDLDIYAPDETPLLAIELKDRPFTAVEVGKAAMTAYNNHAPSLLFIAGRASALSPDIYRYFDEIKEEYEQKGMMLGITSIDHLLDAFFATRYDTDAPFFFEQIASTIPTVHASPEAMRWIHGRLESGLL